MSKIWFNLLTYGRWFKQTCYLMVGVHDYDYYVAQQRKHNPHTPVMTKRQFLDYCQNKRLQGKGGSRCC